MKKFLNMVNPKENKKLFIQCDCGSEILAIEYDFEIKMADFAIFQTDAALKNKHSLWQRLRYCWQVLANKTPYSDQMMIDNKHLLDIKQFISELNLE